MSLTEGEVRGVAWVLREPAASLHGSIILREIGLPAVTNVRGATGAFRTGDRIVLRAGAGRVERANAGASSLV
jgi:pyruvate,water dikinase